MHFAKEMIEILLNMQSHNITARYTPIDSFVLLKDRDIKIDLFYLIVVQDFTMDFHSYQDHDTD